MTKHLIDSEQIEEILNKAKDIGAGVDYVRLHLEKLLAKCVVTDEPVAEIVMEKIVDWMKPHEKLKWYKEDFEVGTKFYTAPQIPEGMALVPVELDDETLESMVEAYQGYLSPKDRGLAQHTSAMELAHKAMLSVAVKKEGEND